MVRLTKPDWSVCHGLFTRSRDWSRNVERGIPKHNIIKHTSRNKHCHNRMSRTCNWNEWEAKLDHKKVKRNGESKILRCRADSSHIREKHARYRFYKSSLFKTFTVNNDFFKLISNSPTSCSYQNRSSCSVGSLLDFFPAPVFPSASFFSHNFIKTTVIIPQITAPKEAPFQNSSEKNIVLVCPDQAQIKPHTVKENLGRILVFEWWWLDLPGTLKQSIASILGFHVTSQALLKLVSAMLVSLRC